MNISYQSIRDKSLFFIKVKVFEYLLVSEPFVRSLSQEPSPKSVYGIDRASLVFLNVCRYDSSPLISVWHD